MKNLNLKMSKMLLTATLVMVFILSGTKSKAQCAVSCDYIVQNLLNCDVTISWQAYTTGPCQGNAGPITILAGQTHTITCADFNPCVFPVCDLDITVLTMNGSNGGLPVTANFNTSPNPNLPTNAACSAGTPHMAWNPAATIIHQ